ncbi:hypothetical protein BpHYR1_040098 [Brachionus plicatilis]|uniref:Uncharacterized protein n=1 Tax=Brachionus plicatilis TaxID=10195 RepID=A0A3M7T956_BRAPC|nr:hypothetical protein BpHYR1_040098 [Brachionus plicatilis]
MTISHLVLIDHHFHHLLHLYLPVSFPSHHLNHLLDLLLNYHHEHRLVLHADLLIHHLPGDLLGLLRDLHHPPVRQDLLGHFPLLLPWCLQCLHLLNLHFPPLQYLHPKGHRPESFESLDLVGSTDLVTNLCPCFFLATLESVLFADFFLKKFNIPRKFFFRCFSVLDASGLVVAIGLSLSESSVSSTEFSSLESLELTRCPENFDGLRLSIKV